MFKKFKQYSRRERTFRKVEFFKEEDIQLLQELDRAKEYKRLNINFDTYKEPHNHFPLGLEGVILCVDSISYNKIYDVFLDNHATLSKKIIKSKKMPKKLNRYIRYLQKRHDNLLNMNNKHENPWLFERNSRREIRNIVFLETEESPSPRLHSNTNYQRMLIEKMDEIMEKQRQKEIAEGSPCSSQADPLRRKYTLAKRPSLIHSIDEKGAVPMSSNLNVIPHANEIIDKKYIRTPTAITIKDFRHSETAESPIPIRRTITHNLMFLRNKSDFEDSQIEFDQDFILCTVFGYKNVYVKEGDDFFDSFIPVKRNDYAEQHE